MNGLRLRRFALLVVCCVTAFQPLYAVTRVALALTEPTPENDSVLALAEAKASALHGVTLIERREIDRVLREQKLSLAGLVDADNAVQAGKLLGADILGVVEMNPQTKNAVGLVVFDVRSGVQLWNVALPKEIEKAATAIASGVQQAVAKAGLKARSRRVVSLLTIRNADMPRSMDRFCDAVGVLLERDLMQNPAVVVLERRRLDQLNGERVLSTDALTNSLLASVTLVSIDVNRSENRKGLEAVAMLSNLNGRTRDRLTVAVPTQDAAKLAEALAARVNQSLGVERTEVKPDPVLQRLEAQRFLREAQLRLSHNEVEAAWRSAEAAYALDPNDLAIEAVLTESLLHEGRHLLENGRIRRTLHLLSPPRKGYVLVHNGRTRDELLQALDFGLRSLSFRATRLRSALRTGDVVRMYEEELRAGDTARPMVDYVESLYWYCGDSTDADVKESYEQFRRQYLDLDLDRFECWARLAKENPKVFARFTQVFTDVIATWPGPAVRHLVPKPDEFLVRIDHCLRLWLGAANAHPLSDESRGRVQVLFGQLSLFVLNLNPFGPYFCLREQDTMQPQHLGRLKPFADTMVASPSSEIRAEGKMLRTLLDERIEYENQPQLLEQTLAKRHDAFRERPPQETNWTPAPWTSPIRILNAADFPQSEGFCHFVVTEDSVYAFDVKRNESPGPQTQESIYEIDVHLIRARLGGDKPVIVHQTRFTQLRGPKRSLFIPQAQAVGTSIYALIDLDRYASPGEIWAIYEFPTDGRPAARLDDKFDLPERNFQSFAVLDNKLYLGAKGFIYSCDLTSKSVEVLASSRRSDKQSELDGGELFLTPFMLPDPPRNRVILVTQPFQRATSFGFSEIWSLDVVGAKLTKLVASNQRFYADRITRAGEDALLFSSTGAPFTFDLARDELHRLDGEPASPFQFRGAHEWYPGPHLIHKGYFWSACAFGRINLENKQRQYFQPIIPTHWRASLEQEFVPGQGPIRTVGRHVASEITSGCLATVENGTKLVFCTSFEVWLLPLCEAK